MDYLEKVLGIKTGYENYDFDNLPNFICSRYMLQKAFLDGIKVIFVYPKIQIEQNQLLKKHISWIRNEYGVPVVIVLNKITSRQKESLMKEKIPFIVEGKQIYLPFMAVYLQEKCDGIPVSQSFLLPSAQQLLLYFIYSGTVDLSTAQAAERLDLSPMSISRASKQLESLGLVNIRKEGVHRILYCEDNAEKLFMKAQEYLINPVRKTVYVPKEYVMNDLLKSNLSALSDYTMLNPSMTVYYAAENLSEWKNCMSDDLMDSQSQVAIEIWKYDPKKLSTSRSVDILSLALSLKGNGDERVEEAIEIMMEQLWRKINDSGNGIVS